MSTIQASVLEAPRKAEGESKQLDLARFAYDEHRCVTPPVDLQVLAQLYDRNSAHKACVDAKTTNCVGLGWSLEPKDGADADQARELATEITEWLELLARRDDQSFDDLLIAARMDEKAIGFAAIEISRNGRGYIDGLYHVHAYTLRRRKDRDGWVQKVEGDYRYFRRYGTPVADTKNPEQFEGTNEILIIGGPAPSSPFYPLPDIVPAMGAIAGDEQAERYQLQFFQNNAVPRLAIIVEGGQLDPTTTDYILAYLRDGVRGDAHKVLLLQAPPEGGLDMKIRIEKLTVGNREEADFLEYRKFNRDTVIMAHRVSPSKVTIVENANLANSKDQDKTFKEQVIKPDQNRWEKRLQWLLEDELGAKIPVRFRFAEMDLADEEQIARTRAVYMPALANNEVRDMIHVGAAGVDPETGAVIDPALEEWGRQPFEGTFGSSLGDGAAPLTKSIRPELASFVAAARDLGYLIERVEERLEGEEAA